MEEEEGADTVKREEEEEEPKASSSMLSSAPAPPLPSIMTSPSRLSQADLLRQQPSMRPDERGYDPVRYDHPYIRQLGVSERCDDEMRSVRIIVVWTHSFR